MSYSRVLEDCVDAEDVERAARRLDDALSHASTSRGARNLDDATAISMRSGRCVEIQRVDYPKILHFFQTRVFALLHRSGSSQDTLNLGELVDAIMHAPKFSAAEREITRALCKDEVADFLHDHAIEVTVARGDGDDIAYAMTDTCALLKSRIVAQKSHDVTASPVWSGARNDARPNARNDARSDARYDARDNARDNASFARRIVCPTVINIDPWSGKIRPAAKGSIRTVVGEPMRQLIRRAKLHDRSLVSRDRDIKRIRPLPTVSRYDPSMRRTFLTTLTIARNDPTNDNRADVRGGVVDRIASVAEIDARQHKYHRDTTAEVIRAKILNAYGRWTIVEPRFTNGANVRIC